MSQVYAVRDSALGAFLNPFVAPSAGIASRSFAEEANKSDSPISKHPKDYELFQLGDYDADSGRITPLEAPRSICRASDFVLPTQPAALTDHQRQLNLISSN